MNKRIAFSLATVIALQGLVQADDRPKSQTPTAETNAKKSVKGEHLDSKPHWIIVEEDFWFPLRFEPLETLDAARYHYRRNQEKSAANEIRKSVSWLNLAANHALPETKKDLLDAATELKELATDLEAGKLLEAKKLDGSLAKAAHALATWHYFRAKESFGKTEEANAGKELLMAANYVQNAANSAHIEFGPDTQEVITKIFLNGKEIESETRIAHNSVAIDLEGIESALKELAATMKK